MSPHSIMWSRKGLFIIVAIGVFITTLLLFFVIAKTKLSPESEDALLSCKTLKYSGQDKTNLLFIGGEQVVKSYSSYLFSKEPFSRNQDNFNIYYLDNYDTKDDCNLYKDVAVLCYSKKLLNTMASCPHDFTIVLTDQDPEIRSSAYRNIASLNQNHPKTVILHELGHILANFAEEYVIPSPPSLNSRNCAKKCESFIINNGCFAECSDEGHYRSIETGVMRSLATEDYGVFNDNLLQEKITGFQKKQFTFAGKAIAEEKTCAGQTHHLITLKENQGILEVLDKQKTIGCAEGNIEGQLKYEVITTDGAEITGFFNEGLLFTDVQEAETIKGETFTNNDSFFLSIDAPPEAERVSFMNQEGEKIGETSLLDTGARPCRQ